MYFCEPHRDCRLCDLPWYVYLARVSFLRFPSDVYIHPILGTSNRHANYAALFLQIVGVYSTAPCIGTWSSNNVQPHYRRATAIGLNFICTNIGGTRFPLCAITFPQLSTTDVQTPRHSLYMDLHSPPAVSRCVRHQPIRFARHGVFLRNPDGLPQVAQRSEARTGRPVDEREWGRSGTWRMEFT